MSEEKRCPKCGHKVLIEDASPPPWRTYTCWKCGAKSRYEDIIPKNDKSKSDFSPF